MNKNYEKASRKVRGLTQAISLIATIKETNGTKTYIVKGESGNTYKVSINGTNECTCPDFVKRHEECKHIYFVLGRVLKVDIDDKPKAKVVYNKHLLFENLLMNSFHFVDMVGDDVLTSMYNYIEKIYDTQTKDEAKELFENKTPVDDILKDKEFFGVYLTQVNSQIYELHIKSIEQVVNKGWFYNSKTDKVVTQKIARFVVVEK